MFSWKKTRKEPSLADQLSAITSKTREDLAAKINAVVENAKKVCIKRLQESAASKTDPECVLNFSIGTDLYKSIEGLEQLTVGETQQVISALYRYLSDEGITLSKSSETGPDHMITASWPVAEKKMVQTKDTSSVPVSGTLQESAGLRSERLPLAAPTFGSETEKANEQQPSLLTEILVTPQDKTSSV